MARYQMILAYDGTHFQGFQRQGSTRTVQRVVEEALRRLGWQGRAILAAGRTDSGVHASGQVIAFDLDWAHSPDALGRAVNAALPADVSIRSTVVTGTQFHPRYDATARTYQYHLYCSPERDPLCERYAWRVWPPVQLELLQAAAQLLVGVHDFAAFGTPPRPGGTTVRQVLAAGWQSQAGCLLFEISANAFLYHMVRRVVFLQVLAGQNRLDLEHLAAGVNRAQPQPPGLAQPQGLVLTEVRYDGQGKMSQPEDE